MEFWDRMVVMEGAALEPVLGPMKRPVATHCRRGHDLTLPDAVWVKKAGASGSAERICKVCAAASKSRYAERKKQKQREYRERRQAARLLAEVPIPLPVREEGVPWPLTVMRWVSEVQVVQAAETGEFKDCRDWRQRDVLGWIKAKQQMEAKQLESEEREKERAHELEKARVAAAAVVAAATAPVIEKEKPEEKVAEPEWKCLAVVREWLDRHEVKEGRS